MPLIQEWIEIQWNVQTKKKFQALGYVYTKMGDPLFVQVIHMMKYSKIQVQHQCDGCGEVRSVRIDAYLNNKANNCSTCASYLETTSKKRKATNIEKFGVENPFQSEQLMKKAKETNLQKYGVKNIMQSIDVRQKKEQNFFEKHGVKNPMQSKSVRNKKEETCLNRYGVRFPGQAQSCREKQRETMEQRYGVAYPIQSEEIKEKIKDTMQKKHGVGHPSQSEVFREKVKQTMLDRHGVVHPFQSDQILQKFKKTLLDRYGVEHPHQLKSVREKSEQTMMDRYGVKNGFQIVTIENPSAPQRYLANLLDAKEEIPLDCYRLDLVLPGHIVVEYHGTGHAWNQDEQTKVRHEKRRRSIIYQSGYCLIEIDNQNKSNKDQLPSDEIILKLLAFAKNQFNLGSRRVQIMIKEQEIIVHHHIGSPDRKKRIMFQEIIS